MATICTRERFQAPASRVWEHITNAALLQTLGGCDSIRPLGSGEAGLFDEGAVREVRIGGRRVVERVINVRKPVSLEVEVLESTGRIRQDYEHVELIPWGTGCELIWTIRFRVQSAIFAELLSCLVALVAQFRFRQLIRKLKSHVEAAESLARLPLTTTARPPASGPAGSTVGDLS
jgi:Polyketide cyclase / dehydrase and lipid transport